jgi:CMP-N-acetylneuraminic acid synthetase
MIAGQRVVAIVPARAGSKGLPDKNVRMLQGKPLLAWPIEAARQSKYVDDVIISTDSREFAELAKSHGARVPFLRPAEHATDEAPSIGFIRHAIEFMAAEGEPFDLFLLLEPTSPLTEAQDIDQALEKLVAAMPDAEALVGVTAMVTNHPAYAMTLDQEDRIRPLQSSSFDALPRRQDLDPVFCLDGSLYLATTTSLMREDGFCHDRTIAFETAPYKAFEVDDLVDFICIEAIASRLEDIRKSETD